MREILGYLNNKDSGNVVQYILSTFDEKGNIFVIHVFLLIIYLIIYEKERKKFHKNNNERNLSEVDY